MNSKPEPKQSLTIDDGMMISPKQLAQRWGVSASTVSRICERAGINAYYLGEGKNGTIRYRLREIASYEERCKV